MSTRWCWHPDSPVFYHESMQANLAFKPAEGIFLFPHSERRKHLLFLSAPSPLILLPRDSVLLICLFYFISFFCLGASTCVLSSGNLLKMRHPPAERSKPNLLVSLWRAGSWGLAVLNSITGLFYLFIFLNRWQSTTRQTLEITKGSRGSVGS